MLIHRHHVVPKHAGGDPKGYTEELTPQEHAEAHRLLWEKYGDEYDRIAWLALSGYIGKEEIIELKMKEGARRGGLMGKGKPKPKSEKHRRKIGLALKAKGIVPPSRKGCKMPEWFGEQARARMLANNPGRCYKGYKWYHNGTKRVWYKPTNDINISNG